VLRYCSALQQDTPAHGLSREQLREHTVTVAAPADASKAYAGGRSEAAEEGGDGGVSTTPPGLESPEATSGRGGARHLLIPNRMQRLQTLVPRDEKSLLARVGEEGWNMLTRQLEKSLTSKVQQRRLLAAGARVLFPVGGNRDETACACEQDGETRSEQPARAHACLRSARAPAAITPSRPVDCCLPPHHSCPGELELDDSNTEASNVHRRATHCWRLLADILPPPPAALAALLPPPPPPCRSAHPCPSRLVPRHGRRDQGDG
jgi:hypothetical protein